MENLYIRIGWPFIQEYMEYPWFDTEAILDNREDVQPMTYLIPLERFNETAKKLKYKPISINEE